jgi:hypothetical protein
MMASRSRDRPEIRAVAVERHPEDAEAPEEECGQRQRPERPEAHARPAEEHDLERALEREVERQVVRHQHGQDADVDLRGDEGCDDGGEEEGDGIGPQAHGLGRRGAVSGRSAASGQASATRLAMRSASQGPTRAGVGAASRPKLASSQACASRSEVRS